jgi:hypothetical protein
MTMTGVRAKLTFDNDLAIVNLVNFDCCSESPGCVCFKIDHRFRPVHHLSTCSTVQRGQQVLSGVARQTAVIFMITVDRRRAISGVFYRSHDQALSLYPAEKGQLLPLSRS